MLEDLTRQTAGLEIATGPRRAGGGRVGAPLVLHGWIAAPMLPLLVLISIAAFLPVSEIAQVGRQLADTIASTRRLHVVHAEPVVIADGPLEPARARWADRRCAFDDVGFTYPGRFATGVVGRVASRCRRARRWRWSDRPARARPPSPICCCGSGTRTRASIRLDGVDLRQLTLDGLRGRIALVAQDTYLFNDTLERQCAAGAS